jgi:hypothetical protein
MACPGRSHLVSSPAECSTPSFSHAASSRFAIQDHHQGAQDGSTLAGSRTSKPAFPVGPRRDMPGPAILTAAIYTPDRRQKKGEKAPVKAPSPRALNPPCQAAKTSSARSQTRPLIRKSSAIEVMARVRLRCPLTVRRLNPPRSRFSWTLLRQVHRSFPTSSTRRHVRSCAGRSPLCAGSGKRIAIARSANWSCSSF